MNTETFQLELQRRLLEQHQLPLPKGDELLAAATVLREMLELTKDALVQAHAQAVERHSAVISATAEGIFDRARHAASQDRRTAAEAAASSVASRVERAVVQLEELTAHHRRLQHRATWTCAGFAALSLLAAVAALLVH